MEMTRSYYRLASCSSQNLINRNNQVDVKCMKPVPRSEITVRDGDDRKRIIALPDRVPSTTTDNQGTPWMQRVVQQFIFRQPYGYFILYVVCFDERYGGQTSLSSTAL